MKGGTALFWLVHNRAAEDTTQAIVIALLCSASCKEASADDEHPGPAPIASALIEARQEEPVGHWGVAEFSTLTASCCWLILCSPESLAKLRVIALVLGSMSVLSFFRHRAPGYRGGAFDPIPPLNTLHLILAGDCLVHLRCGRLWPCSDGLLIREQLIRALF
jgi:hypothetical protein